MTTAQPSAFLKSLQNYYSSGVTRPFEFRQKQLKQLRRAIEAYEPEIYAALYSDLKKSREEAFASEVALALSDIRFALKHLRKWMKPQKVKTNLVNLFSSSRIHSEPRGLVLIIGAWNYPFLLSIQPVIGAIAAGNCVVLKPSELAPATSAVIARMIAEYFDDNFFRVVEGKGEEVIPLMMDAIRFDYIFYTGSTRVGQKIYEAASKKLIPVTLELGGKSPAVVEASADLKTTAKRIVLGKFLNAGQTCVAPDYVLVHESVKETLTQELARSIRKFYTEHPEDFADYGKIINASRFDVLRSYLRGDQVAFGGRSDKETLFIEPTLLTRVDRDHPVMKEEIFGPILPLIPFQSKEEAHNIILKNPQPLSFYLFTSDDSSEKWWMNNLSFGGGCVNNTIWQLSNMHLPFGGIGESGIGAYHGKYSFETFTHRKAVMKTPTWFDPSIKYPPYGGRMKLLRMLFK